jgi:hypothetical protein
MFAPFFIAEDVPCKSRRWRHGMVGLLESSEITMEILHGHAPATKCPG